MKDRGPSQNKHVVSGSVVEVDAKEEEKRQMHHELWELMHKYTKMAKKMSASSFIDQLITSTNLSYKAEIMVAPLPPKFLSSPDRDIQRG